MAGIPFSIVQSNKIASNFTTHNIIVIGPDTNNICMIDTIRFGAIIDSYDYMSSQVTFEIAFGTDYGPGNTNISSKVACKKNWFPEVPAIRAYSGNYTVGGKDTKEFVTSYLNGSDEYIWFSHWDADDIKLTSGRVLLIKIAELHIVPESFELFYTVTIEGSV
jgi:hypothetical protein